MLNDPRLEAECYLNNKPFRIPVFVILDEAEGKSIMQKYRKERQQIKKLYQGRNFLEVTLKKLK